MIEHSQLVSDGPRNDAAIARGKVLRSAIALAAEGDDAAFESLVTVLHRLVHRWSLTFARDPDEADEITQETFVLVHRKLGQYRGDASVEGWVYRITRRVALQRHRKDRRRRELSEAAFLGRIAEYVRIFFTQLPPKQREVFDLVDLQGHEPAEVARLLGTNAGTVRGNLFKARSALRARLLEDHPSWRELEK